MSPLVHYRFAIEVIHKDIEDGCSPQRTELTASVSSRKRLKHLLDAQLKKFVTAFPDARSVEVRVLESRIDGVSVSVLLAIV